MSLLGQRTGFRRATQKRCIRPGPQKQRGGCLGRKKIGNKILQAERTTPKISTKVFWLESHFLLPISPWVNY